MKKSQLRKIIKESIKELMSESNHWPWINKNGTKIPAMLGCEDSNQGVSASAPPICVEGDIRVGDTLEFTSYRSQGQIQNNAKIGKTYFVVRTQGHCTTGGPNDYNSGGTYYTANINQSTCTNCCNRQWWTVNSIKDAQGNLPDIGGFCWRNKGVGCGNVKLLDKNPLIHKGKK